jgi:hypothetical protein
MQFFVQIHPFPERRLPQSFENFAELLSNLPGMYFEMDGSFVWVEQRGSQTYQMDGMVYDRANRIEYVEIKGACSSQQWQTVCQALCARSIEPEDDYLAIDSILRVHRVSEGDWTTACDIAMSLET